MKIIRIIIEELKIMNNKGESFRKRIKLYFFLYNVCCINEVTKGCLYNAAPLHSLRVRIHLAPTRYGLLPNHTFSSLDSAVRSVPQWPFYRRRFQGSSKTSLLSIRDVPSLIRRPFLTALHLIIHFLH